MPKTGRPPMTQDQVRKRIEAYRADYGVKDLNEDGFPVYPAGLRETKQHREWITLYKLFSRSRDRSVPKGSASAGSDAGVGTCAICLQPLPKPGKPHRRCADVVEFVRELGVPALDRIHASAFPDDPRPTSRAAPAPKRKP